MYLYYNRNALITWQPIRFPRETGTGHQPLTCDQAGHNERQDQHLQHPHEKLSREGEILYLSGGQIAGAQYQAHQDT